MSEDTITLEVTSAEDAAAEAKVTKRAVIYAIERGELNARKLSSKLTSSYVIQRDEKYDGFIQAQLKRQSAKLAKKVVKPKKK